MVFARLTAGLLAALVAALLTIAPAHAHLTPNSEVDLAIGDTDVLADIIIPQGDYAFASGLPTGNDPASLAKARAYLRDHMAVRDAAGAWTIDIRSIEFAQIAGPPDLHAVAVLTPPAGGSTRRFTIRWTAVLDTMPSHFALFVLSRDSSGHVGEDRTILGAVRAGSTTIAIDRGAPSGFVAFANAVLLGVDHIIGGYDHILFLLALLLPAPLCAAAGRWGAPRSIGDTAKKLLAIVTAFTIGHSLTLIGATLGRLHLPVQPVEIAIAVSVLISAIHAIRPIFPGREPLVAGGFGLIHGLAFATLLAEASVGTPSGAAALLGFNLGIEAVQIAIVALVMPPLVVLSRGPGFTPLRIGLAGFTAAAALAWIVNRASGGAEGLVAAFEAVIARAPWFVLALMAAAVVQLLGERVPSAKRTG